MDIPGLPARRAALKLLDAVLRRGETLDQAGHNAVQGLAADADKALARAIAAEALRWLPDFDALIDSATRQPLPDDAKPRSVLRLMLAQWLRLQTPPHAVVATALPLLAGGPKRLAHGVFATLTRRGATLPRHPTLPAA
ncbi:MAG TPA: transcription antitermination factor NusB, partial [Novosphingobium sp.]|nr:transcription antitermination factor NusB [Novosphingobium sp.]